MKILICGSLAYDSIMVFNDYFKNHILPNQIFDIILPRKISLKDKDKYLSPGGWNFPINTLFEIDEIWENWDTLKSILRKLTKEWKPEKSSY